MKSLFSRFKGKRAWMLLLLAIFSQTSASCASGGNDRPEPSLAIEQGKAGETEHDRQKESTDVMEVEGWTEIKFSGGDSESSVTRDIGFAYIAEWDGVKINWVSSNESVITNEGKVARQQEDKDVTMTANILYKGKNYQENFALTVKKANTMDVNTLEDYTLDQIDQMNKGDKYYEVCMNDSGHVRNIYGTYSDIKVDSWDMALASLYNIKSLLGIGDISSELQVDEVYMDGAYTFNFDQIYKGIRVYGCGISVSSDRNGKVCYLGSSYSPVSGDMGVRPKLTMREAAEYAKKAGYGEIEDDSGMPEEDNLYIYNENGNGIPVWRMFCENVQTNECYMVLVDAIKGDVVYLCELPGDYF